ncbi:DeoR/GlpR family DNA-binding transcription regulator [Psychromonas hadalis]|uniref:DeoR/GlpR family DNA-binding transcription regulator n=1 Tax=Psychromonas hadalis TaxID=211669 RepID=UPI0003B7335B|nr:DeoR/GlpR family DNA-binding transcription regulator [Psychromonas hadalis]
MRKTKLVNHINEAGSATVIELSKHFQVSVETIRRDLKTLDKLGDIVKVHGGAVSKHVNDIGQSFTDRSKNHVDEKRLLVDKALDLISEGLFIGLDASSSSWELAKIMPNINCTVVTNSLNIIQALKNKSNIHVISTGGSFSMKYDAFYGPVAMSTLSNFSLDICFISCVGFDFNSSVWDSNEYNCQIKKSFIEISQEVILIADKTKFKKRSLLKICDINDISSIITNTRDQ